MVSTSNGMKTNQRPSRTKNEKALNVLGGTSHPRTLVIAAAMFSSSAASRLKSHICKRKVTSASCGGAGAGGAAPPAPPASPPAAAGACAGAAAPAPPPASLAPPRAAEGAGAGVAAPAPLPAPLSPPSAPPRAARVRRFRSRTLVTLDRKRQHGGGVRPRENVAVSPT